MNVLRVCILKSGLEQKQCSSCVKIMRKLRQDDHEDATGLAINTLISS